jgi:hypothetical protein
LTPSEPTEPRRAPLWTVAATALSALFSFLTLVLPARGLTFLWDDWGFLLVARAARERFYLVNSNEHFKPIFLAAVDLEHVLFGGDHTLYLAVNWAVHVANVFLLAKLLAARAGDERAGAVAAAAFGVATTYREVLFWATGLCHVLSFLFALAAFLALERALARGGRWSVAAAAAAVASALAWGGGIVVGPALLLEAWARGDRDARARLLVPLAGACVAVVLLYGAFSGPTVEGSLPRTAKDGLMALLFLAELLGLGFVRQVPLLPIGEGWLEAASLSLAYVAVIAALAWVLPKRAARTLLLAQVYFALLLASITLTRWPRAGSAYVWAAHSYYQYWPGLAWTTLVAVLLGEAARRPTRVGRGALAAGALALLPFAIAHARATRRDRNLYTPWARAELRSAEIVARAVSVARSARGPVYNAPVPAFLAYADVRLREIVTIMDPSVSVTWVGEATTASVAALESDPLLRAYLDLR